MGRVAPVLRDLADRILANEHKGRLEVVELATAADQACKKLCQNLAQLIGSYATTLLINRAVTESVVEFPFLKDVEVVGDGHLKGLRENVERRSPDEVYKGLVMMLANFFGLLSDFIGEDMALHLLKSAWPEVLSGESGSRQEGEI